MELLFNMDDTIDTTSELLQLKDFLTFFPSMSKKSTFIMHATFLVSPDFTGSKGEGLKLSGVRDGVGGVGVGGVGEGGVAVMGDWLGRDSTLLELEQTG